MITRLFPRRRPERPAPRHSGHGPAPVSPAQAAAHATAFHGYGQVPGTHPYPDAGPFFTPAGTPAWAAAQDPGMELAPEPWYGMTEMDMVPRLGRPYAPEPEAVLPEAPVELWTPLFDTLAARWEYLHLFPRGCTALVLAAEHDRLRDAALAPLLAAMAGKAAA